MMKQYVKIHLEVFFLSRNKTVTTALIFHIRRLFLCIESYKNTIYESCSRFHV